ncbi:unnamed protein product [Protopolystoma xenopodis]|uniref:SH3 domain-containing protein n=1 Tax=Protopolystoma xenopodis TaxID=117903 RepID=A0A3S5FC83_9PLAT|nr:unnamed protein product [Protopolystoma xenopodis]
MSKLFDDADYDPGEASANVTRPRFEFGNDYAYNVLRTMGVPLNNNVPHNDLFKSEAVGNAINSLDPTRPHTGCDLTTTCMPSGKGDVMSPERRTDQLAKIGSNGEEDDDADDDVRIPGINEHDGDNDGEGEQAKDQDDEDLESIWSEHGRLQRATVLFEFRAQRPDELDLVVNETVVLLGGGDGDNWLKVRSLIDGVEGLAPKNFLRVHDLSSLPLPCYTITSKASYYSTQGSGSKVSRTSDSSGDAGFLATSASLSRLAISSSVLRSRCLAVSVEKSTDSETPDLVEGRSGPHTYENWRTSGSRTYRTNHATRMGASPCSRLATLICDNKALSPGSPDTSPSRPTPISLDNSQATIRLATTTSTAFQSEFEPIFEFIRAKIL